MGIGSASDLRRLVHRAFSTFLVAAASAVIAAAQTPITTGSVVPVQHAAWNQINKVQVAKNGSVVFLDWANSALYQLAPGSTTFTTIASGAPLEASGTFWNSGMTMDAKDTIYITDRYGANHFFRIPYNPADGTWDFTAANGWGSTIGGGLSTYDVAFVDSAAKDGSGTLVVSTETSPSIYTVPVDNQGNWGTAVSVIKGLKAKAFRIAADVNGNIYFVEDNGATPVQRASGLFFIPAGTTGIAGAGDGSAEAQLARIDPNTSTQDYDGITLDAAGNIYLSNQTDTTGGGTFNGTLMIPNISGSPVGVTAASFDYDQATLITPVQSSAGVAFDPRGYLWIPTGTSGWTPPGSLVYPGTANVVLWAPGSTNLGPSPVGTAGPTGTVFFTFSSTTTAGNIVFSQPGTGSDFVPEATNPIADPTAAVPQTACTPGKQYLPLSTCPYWLALDARAVGGVSGELSMLDATNKVIPNSLTYISGVGQGAAVALLNPTTEVPLSSGLVTPQQVTGDAQGNVYVADSGQGKVLKFAPGSSAQSTGASVGTGFSAPTGVAVDGSGDVFIADSGKVFEVPFVNGVAGAQIVLQTGFGTNLKLAVDGIGNVYVADPDKARVAKISTQKSAPVVAALTTVGSAFTKPTAVATDSTGDLFVADGSNLIEIAQPFGVLSTITKSLAAPVTGLAVEPSGSVEVAQSGGILRIPLEASGLNFNDAAPVNSGGVTAPSGIGFDGLGNLYATAASYNLSSVTATGPVNTTVTTPNVLQVSSAFVNFGIVSTQTESDPTDVYVYNIGNAALTFTAAPTFSGPNGSDYEIETDGQTPCDVSGGTAVASGTACTLGVTVTAANTGVSQGTMNVPTNAVNAPSASATLEAFSQNNLCRTQTAIMLNPATGVIYPGSTQVSATTSAVDPTCAPGLQPTGGRITLTFTPQAKGASQIVYTSTLTNGQATFSAKNLPGGTYFTYASYKGDTTFGGSSSSRTFTFTVAPATPKVTLTQPSNITPLNGVYYVPIGNSVTLQANVSSTVGTPVGTVTFLNGTQVADPAQGAVTLDGSGNAVFNTKNLPAGSYSLTASYNGDSNFAATASPAVTFQVIPPSLLITASPAAISIPAGTAGQATLTLTSLVGFAATPLVGGGGVFISCDNTTVPKYSECTFDVQQIIVQAGSTGTTTVTITTNIPVNVAAVHSGPPTTFLAGMFGLGVLGLALRRRNKRYRGALTLTCLTLLFGAASAGLVGCTNSGYTQTPPSPHVVTPSGTYNVSFVARNPVTGQIVSLPFTLPVTVK